MHANNRKWLEDLAKQYPKSFNKCSVLEIGSQDINGTIRDYFTDCDYVGVDMFPGKCVDMVAQYPEFDRQFDTLAIFSAYEHDFEWKKNFKHNLQWLKKGGMCFVCFGAEGNHEHNYPVWRLVPHQEFLDYCKDLGLEVIDSFFEEERYGEGDRGVYDVILKK